MIAILGCGARLKDLQHSVTVQNTVILLTIMVKTLNYISLFQHFYGRARNCYSIAVRAVHRALVFATKGRKLKKQDMAAVGTVYYNYVCTSFVSGCTLSFAWPHWFTTFTALGDSHYSRM